MFVTCTRVSCNKTYAMLQLLFRFELWVTSASSLVLSWQSLSFSTMCAFKSSLSFLMPRQTNQQPVTL
jgi:hypothetical protein